MDWVRIWNDGRMLIDGDRDNFLSVRLYYTHRDAHTGVRGYYLSVTPVRRDVRNGVAILSSCPSDGKRCCVKAVGRRSANSDKDAIRIADAILSDVVSDVCLKNGIDRLDVGGLIFD